MANLTLPQLVSLLSVFCCRKWVHVESECRAAEYNTTIGSWTRVASFCVYINAGVAGSVSAGDTARCLCCGRCPVANVNTRRAAAFLEQEVFLDELLPPSRCHAARVTRAVL